MKKEPKFDIDIIADVNNSEKLEQIKKDIDSSPEIKMIIILYKNGTYEIK